MDAEFSTLKLAVTYFIIANGAMKHTHASIDMYICTLLLIFMLVD